MKRYLFILLAAVVVSSCLPKDEPNVNPTNPQPIYEPKISTDVVPGVIRVKLKEELSSTNALDGFCSQYGVTTIKRTFPECGKFEARTRAEGLHLWYDLVFNPQLPLTKASADLMSNDQIVHVEYIKKYELRSDDSTSSITYKFNDPGLPNQWNFFNPGIKYQYKAGCDINLFPAWEITTGSPDVIVGVVDSGVDYKHEDLRDNMWINEAEYFGEKGVDDDGNGYVDDIYGYNFNIGVTGEMVGTLTAEDHGSNVAGIIAAVNNNGVGYCGIAGGDGSGNGVRIMSCQAIASTIGGYYTSAIKYAADNGAVIINNSWGFNDGDTDVPQSLIDAVNYFVKYAGLDSAGKQVGPMAGGLAVFSAGNSNASVSYPNVALKNIISVAAVGANYKKASYSCYGSWVDISAPGGDHFNPKASIYSVGVTGKEDGYNEMVGTSQAAPHVSGVAALVVSKFGGPGFTVDMLKEILLKSARPLDQYDSTYIGKMGAGLVDAYAALTIGETAVPATPTKMSASVLSNRISLSLIAEEGNYSTFAYDIYISSKSLAHLDLSDTLSSDVSKYRVIKNSASDTTTWTSDLLEFNTKYYIRVNALDRYNRYSDLSNEITQTTGINHRPIFTPLDGTSVSLRPHEVKQLRFKAFDEDNHEKILNKSLGSAAAVVTIDDVDEDLVFLTITGNKAPTGSYTAYLSVSDPYSTSDTVVVNYTIVDNNPPVVTNTIENVVLSSKGETKEFDLTKYFTDKDGEELSYSVISSSAVRVADATIKGSILTLSAASFGTTNISVTAKDLLGKQATLAFDLLVRDGSREVDIYPNPVSDILYLRGSESKSAEVSITSVMGATVYSGSVTVAPFAPAKIDLSNLAAGSYLINIKIGGQTIKQNIVKL